MMRLLLALLVLAFPAAGGAPLQALDGRGRPVAWWVVLKLPTSVRDASDASAVRPTPCDCAPPDCSNVDGETREDRAAGLCYLYADANTPSLRHFRELGFDCLGQGGNDPVSHTLRQKDANPESYWALFNDQLNGIARPFEGIQGGGQGNWRRKDVCSGGDDFSAHAKGAVAVDAERKGGFYLQASTPGFPDPSIPINNSSDDAFVRLGCQKDNNLKFAQHFAAFSLEADQLEKLADALAVARLCSGNFYQGDLGRALASDALWRDGGASGASGIPASLFHALLDPTSTDGLGISDQDESQLLRKVNLTLSQLAPNHRRDSEATSPVFALLPENSFLPAINDQLTGFSRLNESGRMQVQMMVKGPHANVPPWVIVANSLGSDVSVASWWDDGYGIPNICGGDAFGATPNKFCLEDHRIGADLLPPEGRARFNVENLIEATWNLTDGSDSLTWQLVGGGRAKDGNHAKWGITTPRQGQESAHSSTVIFADLNMEGYPCSKACNGSQAGRGGSFFSFHQEKLHSSFTQSLVTKACRCESSVVGSNISTYEDLRMCHHGCIKKIESEWLSEQLPLLSSNATSYWKN